LSENITAHGRDTKTYGSVISAERKAIYQNRYFGHCSANERQKSFERDADLDRPRTVLIPRYTQQYANSLLVAGPQGLLADDIEHTTQYITLPDFCV